MNIFIVAQIMGIIAAGFNTGAMYFKEKKNILKLMLLANVCFAINWFLLGGISAGIISIISMLQIIINYFYDKREKEYPKFLIISYILIAIISGMMSYRIIIDILPVICSILFSLSILQTKEKNIRKIMLLMFLLWTIYSFFIKSYSTAIVNAVQFVMTSIAIVKNDIINKDKII